MMFFITMVMLLINSVAYFIKTVFELSIGLQKITNYVEFINLLFLVGTFMTTYVCISMKET